jgi:hypothetical protein
VNQQLVIADLRHRLLKAIQSSDLELHLPPAIGMSPWVGMSLLQKAIRRSEIDWALLAAATLLRHSPARLWRRLAVIAFEDIGQGDMTAVGHALAATGSKVLRQQLGGDERVAAFVIHSMCKVAKCRAADDLAVVCEWMPELEECRVNFAERSTTELVSIVHDISLPLPHRAIALWYLFGTDRLRSQQLGSRKGGVDAGLEALADLPIPATVLELARLGIQRGAGPLAAFYPLLWSIYATDEGEVFKLTKLDTPNAMVGRVPAWAYDMHVREGRAAIRKLLQTDCATTRWAASVEPKWGNQELLLGMLFRKESGYCRQQLLWSTGNSLAYQADWHVHGIPPEQLKEGYAALELDMDLLHDLRREVVGAC